MTVTRVTGSTQFKDHRAKISSTGRVVKKVKIFSSRGASAYIFKSLLLIPLLVEFSQLSFLHHEEVKLLHAEYGGASSSSSRGLYKPNQQQHQQTCTRRGRGSEEVKWSGGHIANISSVGERVWKSSSSSTCVSE